MLDLQEYKLYSFAAGLGHTRAFTIRDRQGVISDYVLGELGQPKSSFPKKYYNKVRAQTDSVQLYNSTTHNALQVTLDTLVLTSHCRSDDHVTPDPHKVLEQATHIFPGIYSFLNNPKIRYVGMVWSYYKTSLPTDVSVFSHPAAELLADVILPSDTWKKSCASHFDLTFSLRSQQYKKILAEEDYFTITVNIRQIPSREVFPTENEPDPEPDAEQSACLGLMIDVQRFFKPLRNFKDVYLAKHFAESAEHIRHDVQDLVKKILKYKVSV